MADATNAAHAIAEGGQLEDLMGVMTALRTFAVKLTRTPGDISAADLAQLREHGFSDRAMYDIVGIASFFAYVNRVAIGLGVSLEPNWGEILHANMNARAAQRSRPAR